MAFSFVVAECGAPLPYGARVIPHAAEAANDDNESATS
jgi:hypothetical protein